MAETATNGQVNGEAPSRYIDQATFDPDDPEREREFMKPVDVREDMRAMEARKRVSEILNSQAFRDELEDIIDSQDLVPGSDLKTGPHPASLIALQQISQLILPGSSSASSRLAGAAVTGPVVPIADIRGINSSVYTKGERLLRCKLAAVYRLMDLRGWISGIYNHISVRISQDKEHFLINPFGLLYKEITAGSLVKVDMQCNIVDRGNTALGVNKAGFILHAAIHAARPDVKCIIHTHAHSTVAVSSMEQGLLMLSQEAMLLGDISYHEYHGILVDEQEQELIGRNLGPKNKVMFLRNHGVVVCGSTIEEAWLLTDTVIYACENQIRLMAAGTDKFVFPSEEAIKRARENASSSHVNVGSDKKWRPGELEFEAEMRNLDNAGYRTGYVYKLPVLKADRSDRQTSEVEYPPATSVLAYYDEHGDIKPQIREAQERNRRLHKTDWLNTPNVYKKEQIDEIGTENPKKITKWVASTESPSKQGAPIKIENRNQFAPQGTNPREFIQQQRQIKDGYYTDKVTAGYQSKILDGGVVEGQILDGSVSATGDHVMVVGAASKGIIKREHQHNAIVYKSYYATNPFDKMTDEELKDYEAAVKRGEKPPKEEVIADIQKQLVAEVDGGMTAQVSPPTSEPVPAAMQDSMVESETDAPVPAMRRGTDQYSSMKEPSRSQPLVDARADNSPFQRSKSERKPKKGERPGSPDSGNLNGVEDDSHVEDSPSKEGKKKDKSKKEKKGRMPSFSFGKKKDNKKSKQQTAV